MRTIQVVNVRWYNATAWYGVTLAHCLQKAGHESLVAGLAGTPPVLKARELGLPVVELPFNSQTPGRLAEVWKGMDALVRDFRPDIVNCHRGEAFILWAFMKKKYGFLWSGPEAIDVFPVTVSSTDGCTVVLRMPSLLRILL